ASITGLDRSLGSCLRFVIAGKLPSVRARMLARRWVRRIRAALLGGSMFRLGRSHRIAAACAAAAAALFAGTSPAGAGERSPLFRLADAKHRGAIQSWPCGSLVQEP